jgi:hypothetical protein
MVSRLILDLRPEGARKHRSPGFTQGSPGFVVFMEARPVAVEATENRLAQRRGFRCHERADLWLGHRSLGSGGFHGKQPNTPMAAK